MEQKEPLSPVTPPSPWENNTRILAAFFLVVFGFLAIFLLKPVFNVVVLGFLFSFILFYPVKALAKRMPKHYPLAESIIYAGVALLFTFLVLNFVKILVVDSQQLANALRGIDTEKLQSLISIPIDLASQIQKIILSGASALIVALMNVVNGVATLFTGLFVGFLLMMNMHGGRGKLIAWVPRAFAEEIKSLLSAMDRMWVRYMVVQMIYAGCNAVAAYLLFLIFGVPFPLPLAIVVGVLSVVPVVGGILGSLVIGAVCLLLGSTKYTDMPSWQFALIVMIIQFLISQGIYIFIGLPLTGKMVKLPIVVVLVGAMIGLSTGNILVAFLSVPLISTAKVFGSYFLSKALNLEKSPVDEYEPEKDPGFFSQLMYPAE